MNVVQGKRKRADRAQQNRDYLEFNRINPVGVDSNPAQKLLNNKSNANDNSFTTVATRGSGPRQSSTYLSITSGRGYAHGEVGIAFINIESPAVNLIQLSDDPWYSGLLMKIHIIDPCQIIVPHTIYDAKSETSDGKMIKFIREEFPNLSLIKVPRRHFNETDGITMIENYCSAKYKNAKTEIEAKYYALAAASGLFKYLQYIHNIFFKENALKLEVQTKYAHMRIDVETSHQLELLPRFGEFIGNNTSSSLFNVLNHCVTSLGKRTLRARILEPMCDITNIKEIQNCIFELNQPEFVDRTSGLIQILQCFNYIERLNRLAMVVPQDDNIRAAEVLVNQALHLKKCLQLVPTLQSRLAHLTSKMFQEISINLLDERYASMLNHIDSVINKNLVDFQKDSNSQLFQRVNCVQSGVNDLVDILRKSYNELTTQIETLAGDMSTKYGQVFKVNYTIQRGFHMILLIANNFGTHDLPDELEIIEIKRKTCCVTTSNLTELNTRIRNVIEEITMQSNVVIAAMLNGILKEIDAIYDLSGFTASLDIMLAYARISNNEGFVCPSFGDEMRIVDAIHPLVERDNFQTNPVPNNIIATPEYNFFIITGPNMSGKTIYIKTIAVMQIMAQLGCFVPAKSALFRITDRISSRMGCNDSMEKGMSTFMKEMIDMEQILENVTPNSLIIMDELCRSTCPKVGVELAWKINKYLAILRGKFNDGKYFVNDENLFETQTNETGSSQIGTIKGGGVSAFGRASITTRSSNWKNATLNRITAPFIFLTTHLHSLTKMANSFFNIVNLNLSVEEDIQEDGNHRLRYTHRIQEGVAPTTVGYGLSLAKTIPFPTVLLNQAIEFCQSFETGEDAQSWIKMSSKRVLSNTSRQILQFNRTLAGSIDNVNDVASVISAGINITASKRSRRPLVQDNLSEVSASTTSAMYDDHLKIDRILYNSYGDIMSLARNSELEWLVQRNDEDNSGISVNDVQNEAIIPFLVDFVQEHQDGLIEAIGKLNFSLEKSAAENLHKSKNVEPSINNEASPMIIETQNDEEDVVDKRNDDRDSDKSSIISIQHSIVPCSVVAEKRDSVRIFPRDHSHSSMCNNGSFENASRMATNQSEIRKSKSPPNLPSHSSSTIPSDFQINCGYTSPPSVNFEYYGSSSSSGSYNSSQSKISQDDSFYAHSTQRFGFDNFQWDRNNGQNRTNDDISPNPSVADSQSRFFGSFQPFMRTQSQNDIFTTPDDHFSFLNVDPTHQHFATSSMKSFELPSFSSQNCSQSQRSRPNLGNIRKNATMNRSNANLSANSEFSSPNEKPSKISFEISSSRSSDSVQSDKSNERTKLKRKLPLIRKAKLNVPSVFGSTSNLFTIPSNSDVNDTVVAQKPPARNPDKQNSRAYDSNYAAAMERLKRIQAKLNATSSVNMTNDQPNQPTVSNQQQDNADTNENNEDFLPPPPGFE